MRTRNICLARGEEEVTFLYLLRDVQGHPEAVLADSTGPQTWKQTRPQPGFMEADMRRHVTGASSSTFPGACPVTRQFLEPWNFVELYFLPLMDRHQCVLDGPVFLKYLKPWRTGGRCEMLAVPDSCQLPESGVFVILAVLCFVNIILLRIMSLVVAQSAEGVE